MKVENDKVKYWKLQFRNVKVWRYAEIMGKLTRTDPWIYYKALKMSVVFLVSVKNCGEN